MSSDPQIIIAIGATMLLAGIVKGIIGLGLPTIGLGVLTTFIGLQDAIVLMLIPAFVTNLWQSVRGGAFVLIVRRLWPLLLSSALMVWPGVILLDVGDISMTTSALGLLLVGYGLVNLAGFRMVLPKKHETPSSISVGLLNGFVTGTTGSLGLPGILLLQAMNFDRQVLVQAMGILFVSSTIMLALSLQVQDMLSPDLNLASLLALLPTLIGMAFGARVRDGLSERQFRRGFFGFLLLLGVYIVAKALGVMG